ncbi:MAG: helix-turn-helix domain-containing protein [Alphaproteobacteria bacterium]|nr:helix-turn-helix domain-containing protein [Alphaproteobacteria bacterium]
MIEQKEMLTVAEFCKEIHICKASFYEMRKQGKMPLSVKVGRRTLISRAAFEKWIADLEAASANDNRNGNSGGAIKQARGRK